MNIRNEEGKHCYDFEFELGQRNFAASFVQPTRSGYLYNYGTVDHF